MLHLMTPGCKTSSLPNASSQAASASQQLCAQRASEMALVSFSAS
jgi:hypothetical protein